MKFCYFILIMNSLSNLLFWLKQFISIRKYIIASKKLYSWNIIWKSNCIKRLVIYIWFSLTCNLFDFSGIIIKFKWYQFTKIKCIFKFYKTWNRRHDIYQDPFFSLSFLSLLPSTSFFPQSFFLFEIYSSLGFDLFAIFTFQDAPLVYMQLQTDFYTIWWKVI